MPTCPIRRTSATRPTSNLRRIWRRPAPDDGCDSYDLVIPPMISRNSRISASIMPTRTRFRSATARLGWLGSDGHIKSPHIKEDPGFRRSDAEAGASGIGSFLSSIEVGPGLHPPAQGKTVTELDLFLKNGREQVLVDPQFLTDPTSLELCRRCERPRRRGRGPCEQRRLL